MYVYIYIDMVGWLKRLMAVATVPGHNLHRQISGSAPKTSSQTLPASFWWSVKRKPDQKEQNPMTASQKPPAHTASPLFQKKTKAVSDTVSYIVIVRKGQGFTSPSDSDITKVFSGNRSRL